MPRTIIIVPTQGHDTNAFLAVAIGVARDLYGGDATILRTTVTLVRGTAYAPEEFSVAFHTRDGAEFDWDTVSGVGTVITISHAFSCDGPNLAYQDGGYQPFGTVKSGCDELTPLAQDFWETVGNRMVPGGKIFLAGCFMGWGQYGSLVASASGRTVYASDGFFGAGDIDTVSTYPRYIERGTVRPPMKRFN